MWPLSPSLEHFSILNINERLNDWLYHDDERLTLTKCRYRTNTNFSLTYWFLLLVIFERSSPLLSVLLSILCSSWIHESLVLLRSLFSSSFNTHFKQLQILPKNLILVKHTNSKPMQPSLFLNPLSCSHPLSIIRSICSFLFLTSLPFSLMFLLTPNFFPHPGTHTINDDDIVPFSLSLSLAFPSPSLITSN